MIKIKRSASDFDDLDLELIYDLIRVFSTIIGIEKNVTLIDKEQWIEFYEDIETKKKKVKVIEEMKKLYGQSMPPDRVIWLNPILCKREYGVLISTIIHELLHVKYPKAKEGQIQDLERNLTGRYDYKRVPVEIIDRVAGDIKCLKTQEK